MYYYIQLKLHPNEADKLITKFDIIEKYNLLNDALFRQMKDIDDSPKYIGYVLKDTDYLILFNGNKFENINKINIIKENEKYILQSNNLDYFDEQSDESNINRVIEYIGRYNYYIVKEKYHLYQIYKNCGYKCIYILTSKSFMANKLAHNF